MEEESPLERGCRPDYRKSTTSDEAEFMHTQLCTDTTTPLEKPASSQARAPKGGLRGEAMNKAKLSVEYICT